MTTLTPHINQYLHGRYQRGEIGLSTVKDLRWTLNGLDESFGDRPLAQLGAAAVDRWLATIRDRAESTRREYLSCVRGFCRWLMKEGRIRVDPTLHVQPIRQARRNPRTLYEMEVARLLRAAPDNRARAILWLMVGCALRCVEVARLRVEDYDGRTITVCGKGHHERTLPVPVRVAAAVNAYLEEVGVTAGPLIRSALVPTQGLAAKTLSGYVRGWMLDAGVKVMPLDGRSAHALRRTCASDIADSGVDLRVVQELLGHVRLETTAAHYLRRVPMETMREAMEGRGYAA